MSSALEKLEKILQLEREQGYRDKAVIGGLERFAHAWRDQAMDEISDETWVVEIARQMRAYSQLTTRDERRTALNALNAVLGAGPPAAEPAGVARETRPPAKSSQRQKAPKTPARQSSPSPDPPSDAPRSQSQKRGAGSANLEDLGLNSPIIALSGIGAKRSKRLGRLGLRTIRDMLYFFPRRYDDFSTLKTINQLEYGEEVTIIGRIWDVSTRRTRSGKLLTKVILEDGSGTIEVTWFNQPHLGRRLKPRRQIVVSGQVDEYLGRLTFQSPEWEPLDRELLHTARLVPVYSLTEGVSARWLRKLMKRTVDYWSRRAPDYLPRQVRQRAGLLDLETALRQIHFPQDWGMLEKARYRLAFDELFLIQIGVLRRRQQWQSEPGHSIPVDDETLQRFVLGLPFHLTGSQQQALDEIVNDLRRDRPMSRLLQGDVGSGKTVVATAAIALTVVGGAQAALMAPTEILAEQHYRTISQLLEGMKGLREEEGAEGFNVQLLTGSTPAAEKEKIYQGLAQGTVDVVVGTHALIQESVEFQQLALAIVDEQHRFGVAQRAALRQKGVRSGALADESGTNGSAEYNPHVLVMTATPIPRSLALTIYGDLDLSVIDEMPPGRKPVQTRVLLPTERERAYAFVRSQIKKGRQAFIICPLVQESEHVEARAAVQEHERLQKRIFPDLNLGLLHGRLKGKEKEEVMGQFARKELDILVSTSVVEVGIDVPNASVMLVEGANRFGLAQLHQFRGRVGRGEHASYCLLIADSTTATSGERLRAVESTHDGFALAEKDLELRGPGEFFGTRQSGLPDLRLAGFADLRLLEVARREAARLVEADPQLEGPELRLLVRRVDQFWSDEGDVS